MALPHREDLAAQTSREAQRGYELNAKVISASDQILGATVQIR